MSNMVFGSSDIVYPEFIIPALFDERTLKALTYHAMRVDIPDNNDKAEMVREMVPDGFIELGTGTNRIAFQYNGLVYKIALDRRGFVDNFAEFKRSAELPMYLAKSYESNMLITVAEYVNVMDQEEFVRNEDIIKDILKDLAKEYLFDDIGFNMKNYCNWGYRSRAQGEDELVVLDYGYLYPLRAQNTKELFRCPKCGSQLRWNTSFTSFICANKGGGSSCSAIIQPNTIRTRMRLDFESVENRMITSLNEVQMPNLEHLEVTHSDVLE